jgi:predicted GIY-YIG superfamily endonuclease
MPWHVYIIRCGDGTLYTGIAADVRRRLAEHRAGVGAKYTRGRGPLRLVHRERCATRSAALVREAQLKRLTRMQKLRIVNA